MLRPSAVDADPDFQDLMRELVTGSSIQAADQLDSAAVHLTPNIGSGAERSPALTAAPAPRQLELFARRVQPESGVLQAPAYGPDFIRHHKQKNYTRCLATKPEHKGA